MHLTLVVAADEAGAIGHNGDLLWHLPDDLKRFKQITLGHPILMGRKTYASIGRPLPGRPNWVLTRDTQFAAEGVKLAYDIDSALHAMADDGAERAMVIGGGDIYRLLLPRCDTVELTRVHTVMPQADTFFDWPQGGWICQAQVEHAANERHAYPFSFETWVRA